MAVSSSSSWSAWLASSHFSFSMSLRSLSRCDDTDTYSPSAIDTAPATNPAMPAVRMAVRVELAAATPSSRAAVEMMPSFAPSTIARSQPTRWP